MEGIDLERSAIENRISSLFTKSLYLILSAVISRNVPGCQVSQENTSDFLNGKKCSKNTDTFHKVMTLDTTEPQPQKKRVNPSFQSVHLIMTQPGLPGLDFLLTESHLNSITVYVTFPLEVFLVSNQFTEVLLSFDVDVPRPCSDSPIEYHQ